MVARELLLQPDGTVEPLRTLLIGKAWFSVMIL
jgi:hypothetical protein